MQDPAAASKRVYLDYRMKQTWASGNTITLPTGYPVDASLRLVYDKTDARAGDTIPYTRASDVLTIAAEDLPTVYPAEVAYGFPYESSVVPSTLFIRDEGGHVNPYAHLSVLKWLVHLNNSADVYASIVSNYSNYADQYWSGLISNDINTKTDQVANNRGTFHIGFKEKPTLAALRLWQRSHLPINITGIDYLGTYNSRGRRF